jgi:hypothetical protein
MLGNLFDHPGHKIVDVLLRHFVIFGKPLKEAFQRDRLDLLRSRGSVQKVGV